MMAMDAEKSFRTREVPCHFDKYEAWRPWLGSPKANKLLETHDQEYMSPFLSDVVLHCFSQSTSSLGLTQLQKVLKSCQVYFLSLGQDIFIH